jgi:protein-tyrosine phosphatase
MDRVYPNVLTAQRPARPRWHAVTHPVDIHCHCLPGLDDGPATVADAILLCRALVREGVETVIATPHQLGRYHGHNNASQVRRAVGELSDQLAEIGIPLQVRPGGDVRIDERIEALLDRDEILTLADGGRYLLLELPHEVFIDPALLIRQLVARGVTTILTHPERHPVLQMRPNAVTPWLERGAVLQITAGSLVGAFGAAAEQAAWYWLRNDQVAVVASDAHDLSQRRPRLAEAIAAICDRLGADVAGRVCFENPRRILEGSQLEKTDLSVGGMP